MIRVLISSTFRDPRNGTPSGVSSTVSLKKGYAVEALRMEIFGSRDDAARSSRQFAKH